MARCVELYLRQGGKFGFVMPWGRLARRQYAGLRAGDYSTPTTCVRVAFDPPWDLHQVQPAFFPVPACVIFGYRNPEANGLTPPRRSGQGSFLPHRTHGRKPSL